MILMGWMIHSVQILLVTMKELYAKERRYDEAGLTSEERLQEKQSLSTKEIQIRIRSRLDCEMSKDSDI